MTASALAIEPAGTAAPGWPEAERLALAQELHDVVSYTIAAMNLQAGVGLHLLADAPERAAESLHAIKATSKDALREFRALVARLLDVDADAEAVDSPLASRLESLADATTGAGIPTRLYVSGSPRPLAGSVSQILYRVVQEALANVLRHSHATSAEILLRYGDAELTVEILDDGVGDPDDTESAGFGLGIAGMRRRVESLGGCLEASPREVLGFRVRASLPELSLL